MLGSQWADGYPLLFLKELRPSVRTAGDKQQGITGSYINGEDLIMLALPRRRGLDLKAKELTSFKPMLDTIYMHMK